MMGVGIIGAGHFGAIHAQAIRAVDGLEVVSVCREDQDAARDFASRFGGVARPDWRDVLADPRVDIVAIATPHHLHEEISIAAARAGKHILLEKPMAPSRRACDAVAAAARQASVHLLVGHTMRFSRPCLKAKEIIDSGILGRPRAGSSWMIKLWMEGNRKPWHLQHQAGGGMLMTAGIHALDRLVWLMGQNVTGVTAQIASLFHAQEVDDTAFLTLRFADGALGQVQSVGHRGGPINAATDIVCENGVLRIDLENGVVLGRNGLWEAVRGSAEPDWMQRAVVREWVALRDAVRGEAELPLSAVDAAHIVAIIEAAYQASADRREANVADQTQPQ